MLPGSQAIACYSNVPTKWVEHKAKYG